MVLKISETSAIENPRRYAAHTVDDLRALLQTGGQAKLDPIRAHFYELEGTSDTYYIHVSPITGNVVLLARWARQLKGACLEIEHLVA